jgi:hypothetical protein
MTSTGFGWAKVGEKIYEQDVLILADGRVMPRNMAEVTKKYGTDHAVGIEEIQILMSGNPDTIIIGTGQNGEVKLTREARNYVVQNKLNVVEGISPKACKYYDTLAGKKAALIHVTC